GRRQKTAFAWGPSCPSDRSVKSVRSVRLPQGRADHAGIGLARLRGILARLLVEADPEVAAVAVILGPAAALAPKHPVRAPAPDAPLVLVDVADGGRLEPFAGRSRGELHRLSLSRGGTGHPVLLDKGSIFFGPQRQR